MKQGVKFFIITIILVAALVGAYFAYTNISSNMAEITKKQNTSEEVIEEKAEASDFKVVDANGIDVKLSDKKGKPVVMNFWATWCGYCVREMPMFETAFKSYGDKIEFMMINLTDGDRETVKSAKKYIAADKYTFPVYFDTYGEALKAYEAYSIPVTVFVNADGTVFDKQIGAFDEESFNAKLEQFLAVQ